MKTGIELIAEERKEQIEVHGFDVHNNDAFYKHLELKYAALFALTLEREYYPENWELWFYDKMRDKQQRMDNKEFYIEQLKIAGALIAAEIDRLQQ